MFGRFHGTAAEWANTGVPNRGYVLAQSTNSKMAETALAGASAGERSYRAIADDRLNGLLPIPPPKPS
jgi:hypothetical protein